MERLTVKWKPKLYDTFDPIDVADNEYSKINFEKLLTKLGEYEDLEEQCIEENQCGLRELLVKWKEFFDDIAALYDYRKAEEQGLLLRLPCKAGDAVWYVEEYCTPKIVRGVVDGYLWYRSCGFALNVVWDEPIMAHFAYTRKEMPFSDIGRCVFLTREEAESALAEKGGAE